MAGLSGQVAVVAGATRGAGRGIARGLGEAGATVYCTGRSVKGRPSPYGRPETIEETAGMVSAAGGEGIAVRVDHSIEAEVRELFERVDQEEGRLDVLVNCVAGEDPLLAGWNSLWKTDLEHAVEAFRQTLFTHLLTAKHAAPLLIKKRRGLIVEVTGSDFLVGGGGGNALNDLIKAGFKGLALRLAEELRSHRVAALAITPGFLRSEAMLEAFGVTEANWKDGGKKDKYFLHSESPLYIGRAVAALAQDKKVLARSGDVVSSWQLAREYGFSDADGSRPDWGSVPPPAWMKKGVERYASLLERHLERTRRYLASA